MPGASLAPWRLIHELAPGGSAIRRVARFGILLPIATAIGVGWALDGLARRRRDRARRLAAVVLGALCVAEQLVDPIRYDALEDRRWIEWLGARVEPATPAFVVLRPDHRFLDYLAQLDAAWVGTLLGKPTVNGFAGSWPPGWPAEMAEGDEPDGGESRARFDDRARRLARRHRLSRESVQVIELPPWYRRKPERLLDRGGSRRIGLGYGFNTRGKGDTTMRRSPGQSV